MKKKLKKKAKKSVNRSKSMKLNKSIKKQQSKTTKSNESFSLIGNLKLISQVLRRDSLDMTTKAGSGHLTSCLSCADIMSSLFFHEMSYDTKNALNPDNDEFILSKGHAAPILYSALYHAGCIKTDLSFLRRLNSPLEGHPVPSNELKSWIKVASGSLGQGLSIGAGMAIASKLQKRKFRTFVLLGDSESSEGSVWEAIQLASHYKLNNLIAIFDLNRLGQRGETMLGKNADVLSSRLISFGWNSIIIDGHNISEILSALEKSRKSDKPFAIIARTVKGKGISFLEDKTGYHGKALKEKEYKRAVQEMPQISMPNIEIKKPIETNYREEKRQEFKPISFKLMEEVSTREAYGKSLAALAKSDSSILALDAEVSNSTFSELVKLQNPQQFIECFIAEQNMISMALGLSLKGFNTFSSTFSAFLTRAFDQIRISAISKANITVCGSHSGLSIGEDGPSQMGLEDIGMFKSIPNAIILYPSEAISTQALVKLASETKGIKYIRTTRPGTKILYKQEEKFDLGDFKVLKDSNNDKIVLIGSGITVYESLKAHDSLKKNKIDSAVIDLYSIRPLNTKKLAQFIKNHGNKCLITEDHYQDSGIGEMISSLLSGTGIQIKTLGVTRVPRSGNKDELMNMYGISSTHIHDEAKKLI